MVAEATTIAIMYDFDKTLTTRDQQEFTFIPEIGIGAEDFWKKSNEFAKEKKMDSVLAYMHFMLDEARYKSAKISRGAFKGHGKDLEYYQGVEDWFDRINTYCTGMGIQVEHYVISSGLKEIIEGSAIYNNFKEVFACEFLYDVNDVAIWPKNVVNYTTKTQFVYRINKGVLDLSDDDNLNKYTPEDDRPVPFRNMLYIGDGVTDVPCMRLVKANGGYSIAVYTDKQKVQEFITHGRVNFIARADYSEGGELDSVVKDILLKIATEDRLAALTKIQRNEMLKSPINI
ncbi:MAG: haloacid dehalogenase-like hydrolase [Oscillospiraceae bacterium]|nr:haloacid dehalogenase-like hydrolase [Oscillospiraceae bacterium]